MRISATDGRFVCRRSVSERAAPSVEELGDLGREAEGEALAPLDLLDEDIRLEAVDDRRRLVRRARPPCVLLLRKRAERAGSLRSSAVRTT